MAEIGFIDLTRLLTLKFVGANVRIGNVLGKAYVSLTGECYTLFVNSRALFQFFIVSDGKIKIIQPTLAEISALSRLFNISGEMFLRACQNGSVSISDSPCWQLSYKDGELFLHFL